MEWRGICDLLATRGPPLSAIALNKTLPQLTLIPNKEVSPQGLRQRPGPTHLRVGGCPYLGKKMPHELKKCRFESHCTVWKRC